MIRRLPIFLTALAFCAFGQFPNGTPGFAQEADAEEAPPATSDQDGSGDIREYVHASRDDWEIRCIESDRERLCALSQMLFDDAGNRVAEINVRALPPGAAAAAGVTVITPLGTLLTEGVEIAIDRSAPARFPFNWCEQVGCIARFGLTPSDLELYMHGLAAQVTIHSVLGNGAPVVLGMPLRGFTAMWTELLDIR